MTARARIVRRSLLALVAAALVLGLVLRSWVDAQTRALVVLTTTLEAPVLGWAVDVVTGEPRVAELVVAGVPTTLFRPEHDEQWPAIVFVNGATPRGRHHPDVRRLAEGLARSGYLVLVPDLPGLARGEITSATAAGAVAVGHAARRRPDALGGRVAFVGVSVGTSLALLAAESPSLAQHVSVVAGIAPYADLVATIRLATTGFYVRRGRLLRYETEPFLALAIGRSLAAGLPHGRDRARLLAELRAVDDDADDPLAGLRARGTDGVGPTGRAVVALLANRDPRRFPRLYRALPGGLRAGIERLSPVRRAHRLRAPVELASAPRDKYFPLEESRALARASRVPVRLTVTDTLRHAVPRASLDALVGLIRLDAFVVRALRAVRRGA